MYTKPETVQNSSEAVFLFPVSWYEPVNLTTKKSSDFMPRTRKHPDKGQEIACTVTLDKTVDNLDPVSRDFQSG
jgi:hypothetical protein